MREDRGLPKGIIAENMGTCKRCGKYRDLRFGVCFDCATPEEMKKDIEALFGETTPDQLKLDTLRTMEKMQEKEKKKK